MAGSYPSGPTVSSGARSATGIPAGAVVGPRTGVTHGQSRCLADNRTYSSSAVTGGDGATGPYMACKGSRLESALPCPAGRSVPGRGGPERRRRPRPDGTDPRSALGPWPTGTTGHERSPTVTSGEAEPQVGRPLAQPARTTPASGSDCGPEGRIQGRPCGRSPSALNRCGMVVGWSGPMMSRRPKGMSPM